MTTHAMALGSLLKRIGNYDKMESFDGRLKLQKTIYLMQTFDLNLGYDFSWYIRGPYCKELTKDGYGLKQVYDSISEGKFKDPSAEQKFLHFLDFIKGHENNADWLEITASIHFLKKVYPDLSKKEILNTVQNKQDYFTFEDCQNAWNYLEKCEKI